MDMFTDEWKVKHGHLVWRKTFWEFNMDYAYVSHLDV